MIKMFESGNLANNSVLQEYAIHFGVAVIIGGVLGYAIGAIASK